MYKRTKLTGNTSYRKSFFSKKLIMTVEVKEQVRNPEAGERLGPMPFWPARPDHPDPKKFMADQIAKDNEKWRTVRTYFRDATEEDFHSLAIIGEI